MPESTPLIRNISDTACMAAAYRARENEQPDALFRDPFARRLAGTRGEQIADTLHASTDHTWAWITRTWLFDQFITEQLKEGVDMVVNLAAGLDTRPYRMTLPPTLKWIEVDLPDLLADKQEALRSETPTCALERIPLDLSNVPARCELFEQLGQKANKALIVTEGLLISLTAEEVGSLAEDLARPASFQRWVLEVASPGLLRMLQQQIGGPLSQAGAPLKFGPPEGPEFFIAHGWRPIDVRSMLKTAARLKRLSLWMRLLSLLPESTGKQGSRPWSGICLLAKK
jgi:methyltransferase (TIGR00027 family)